MSVYDLIGFLGIVISLTGYFFLQNGTYRASDGRYVLIQIISCCCLLISLWQAFNLPAAVMNSLVILISIYGYLKARLRDATAAT